MTLQYKISGTTLPVVTIELTPGVTVYSESGGMSWMSGNVDMNTNTGGGRGRMLKRAVDIYFTRKLGAGLFGGEGFVLQRLTGPGDAFVEFDGEIVAYNLKPGQILKVDTGHVAMFEPTVEFNITLMRGFRNILLGGEGLFLATLRGPGKVWLQTMPLMKLANKILQYLPRQKGGGGGPSGGMNIDLGSLLGGD